MPEIIRNISSMNEFKQLLVDNPGCLILKFSAVWCVPCQKIKDAVEERFQSLPEHVQCVLVDVDESFEVYAYLKNKKMVAGIPAMLMYREGNHHYVPDDMVSGTQSDEIDRFFARCLEEM